MTSIAENIRSIRERMDRAARAAGRDPGEVLLVGASKMNDAAACQAAIAAGIDALGENRVQEMTAKLAEGAYDGAPLHFIGHLQRNKVRQVVGRVALIQSVGSLALLEEIDRRAAQLGIVQRILLEVFAGAERALELPHVEVQGLMAIPPEAETPHGNLHYFQKVARLYVDIGRDLYDNRFVYLSMGMSGDFRDAIAAGANMVRVGSAIFGARKYV